MNIKVIRALLVVLCCHHIFNCTKALGQGTFVNLDFEDARYPLPNNFTVPTARALPGWTSYIGGNSTDMVLYNTVALDSAAVDFHDENENPPTPPFHGLRHVGLQASFQQNPRVTAAIGQTGQIPFGSQSLVFYAQGPFLNVTFGAQAVPTYFLGPDSSGYLKFAADIAPYAGQTGELRFTVPSGGGNLDFIQFSTTPVPEPGTWALLGLGSVLFWCAARRRRK